MQIILKLNNGPTNFNQGSALFGLYFNRGTASSAPRHCPEALGVSFDVVDGLCGVVGCSQSGDDALAGGGGGADTANSDVEELVIELSQCSMGLPRGTASIEIKTKIALPRLKLVGPVFHLYHCFYEASTASWKHQLPQRCS